METTTTVAEALELYLATGQSMVQIAKQTGVNVDDLHRAVDRHSKRLLSRMTRAAKKAIGDRPIGCEILSHSCPLPRCVSVEIAPKSAWLKDAIGERVEIDTDEPIGPQVAAAIDTVAEAIDADHTTVHDADLPCGVYDVLYYYYRHGRFERSASCDSNVGEGYIQRLMAGRLELNEVAVASCQSQPGGAVIAGSPEALRRWLSQ